MKRILLSAMLILTATSLFSLPGCEVHETDRVVYDHHGHPDWDHHDYDHHDDHEDHHEEHVDVHY